MGKSRLYSGDSELYSKNNGINRAILPAVVVLLILLSCLSAINIFNADAARASEQSQIEYLAIETVIDNNYAVTEIYEMFINPNNSSIEETFTFQIPEKAFISNFSLASGNEIHYAQIVPKDVGEQQYQQAKINGTDAGLVESKGKNIFSYSVSLSPYQKLIVGLRYEQFIAKSLGGYEYNIPLSGLDSSRDIDDFSINVIIKADMFVTDVKVDNYHNQADVNFVSAFKAEVLYETNLASFSEDFIVNYELASPPLNGTILNYNDGTEEFFFHVFSPQRSDLGGRAMDKEIIFVLDKSGSMSGTKIDQLKSSFNEIIDQLPVDDSFNVIMFDSSFRQYEESLIIANSENKNQAVDYINKITADGSTNINDPLISGLEMFKISETKVPIIVLLTDGLANTGVSNTATLRENVKLANTAGVAIFCLGFGFDVDFDFLKALALENFGIAQRIFEGEDASEQITNFYDTISTPLLKGLTFSYSEDAYEIYPTEIDQLFEGSEAVVLGKYKSGNEELNAKVDATSWSGMRTFSETFKLDNSSDNSFIPRLWAYEKIQYLLEDIAVNGEDENIVENITELALEYGFVTPYTSLFVEIKESDKSTEGKNDGDNSDGDGVPDTIPIQVIDSDGDGYSDDWETVYGYDPSDPNDPMDYPRGYDPDGDGVPSGPFRFDDNQKDNKSYTIDESGEEQGISPRITYNGKDVTIPFFTIMLIAVIISIFFYSRIKRNRLLEQKRREMIFNYIKEHPGEHFRGIQKELKLEVGVVGHHINILEREELVKSRQDGMYRRFYPMDAKIDVELILNKIQEKILNRIKLNPGISQINIATKIGVNRKVVNYHVKILQDSGFIYTQKEGRESLCYFIEPASG
jgi:predicted transcriptional regulator/uncharacterized protein YegL